jgi:hypothetical protein
MSILLRTLTLKSKIGVGKYKDETVEHAIQRKKQRDLISMYYKLTTINFNTEVLELLGITGDWIIKKPSSNKDMYYDFLNNTGYIPTRKNKIKNRNKQLDRMKSKTNPFDPKFLQRKNHGH